MVKEMEEIKSNQAWALEPRDNEDVTWRPEEKSYTMPKQEEYDEALKKAAGRKPNSTSRKPRNIDLIVMLNTGKFPDRFKHYDVPVNSVMDREKDNGIIIERFRRKCQRCEKHFIGMGPYNRRCLTCKNLKEP